MEVEPLLIFGEKGAKFVAVCFAFRIQSMQIGFVLLISKHENNLKREDPEYMEEREYKLNKLAL